MERDREHRAAASEAFDNENMKCPDDQIELQKHTSAGVDFASCPKCHSSWIPLTQLGKYRSLDASLKTPPNAKAQPCIACSDKAIEKSIAGARILVCDTCEYAWVSKSTLAMLMQRPTNETACNVEPLVSQTALEGIWAIISAINK